MHLLRLSPCLALFFVLLAAPQLGLAADDARVAALEAQVVALEQAVAELRAAGAAPADRLTEIERQIAVLAGEVENLKVGDATATAVAGTTGTAGLAPAASKVYAREQGLSIGGYGEWLYEHFASEREDGAAATGADTFDALRGIVYVGYKFDDQWLFNSEIEYEHASTGKGGEVSLEFAYLDYRHRPELGLRAGLLLVPMGLVNELHEPTTFLGATRPDTERVILPSTWRENGLGAYGSAGGFDYRSYVLTGLRADGFTAGGLRGGRQQGARAKAEDFAWVGRLDYTAQPGLIAGGSLYWGSSGQDLDGGDLSVPTLIGELHVDWRLGGLELRGLYARAELDDVAELNQAVGFTGSQSVGETLEGFYLQAGYDLLAGRGGEQALTPYLRWEQLDTQAAVPDGWSRNPANDREVLTLGLDYKPLPQLVFKLDWEQNTNAADSGVDQVNFAIGYIF
jgi:hypothetical protein